MKNDTMKCYNGNLILRFGVPRIITVAWESATNYHYEAAAIIDRLNQPAQLALLSWNPPKNIIDSMTNIQNTNDALAKMESVAYENAKERIIYMMEGIAIAENHNFDPITVDIRYHQEKYNLVTSIRQIDKNNVALIDWLKNQSKSDLLKQMIDFSRSIKIDVNEYKP